MAYAVNVAGLRAILFSLRKRKCILFCSLKCEKAECHFIPYSNLRNEMQSGIQIMFYNSRDTG